MAFDPVINAVIAVRVGGIDGDPAAPSATWWWDGIAWHRLAPAHPPAIGGPPAVLVLDPLTNRLVLAGPSREPSGPARQTWMWDGRDWLPLQPASQPSVPLAAVDNQSDGVAEVFGWNTLGGSASPALGVWAWSGNTWVRLADGGAATRIPGISPPPRQFAATAYDTADQHLVLFGGNGAAPGAATPTPVLNTPLLDTWTFDGGRWTQIAASRHPPASGPMVFDPLSGTILLVANASFELSPAPPPADRTWSWNGSTWRPFQPRTEIAPSARVEDMVADPATRRVVAVTACCGGAGPPTATQTWTWSGSTWSLQHPKTELPAGLEFVMAYDPDSQRVLVVGNEGSVGPATTWAWDGSTWTALHPTLGAVFDPVTATIATDPQRQTVVLVTTLAGIQNTEVWNGSLWVDDPGTGPYGADTGYGTGAMYHDTATRQIVLLSSSADDFSDEWMWTGDTWLQLAPQ